MESRKDIAAEKKASFNTPRGVGATKAGGRGAVMVGDY